MSQHNSSQMTQPSSALRMKMGARIAGIDPAAIARAEAALQSLSGNFIQWLQDEVAKLDAARHEVHATGSADQAMDNLYLRAHDLKGLGATYGYPLIGRMASSLCKLTEDRARREVAPPHLIDGHIDAIKAVLRDDIKTADHPVGQALVRELERGVSEIVG